MEIYRRDSQSPQPLLVNARDAARMLAVCERTIYNLVERGELSIIHIGRATRFAVADLREEPGEELLFLTRSAIYSYSTLKDGYADNLQKLTDWDLIATVPTSRTLVSLGRSYAGPYQPEGFEQTGHRGGGAHHHAGAAGKAQRLFDLVNLGGGQLAGAVASPIAPTVGTGPQALTAPRAGDHCAGSDEQRRYIG